MKKEYSIWISIIAIIVSIASICVSNPNKQELGFDYQGIIVGVLSVLVTALIGWQIYNSIEINRKVDGTEDMARRITNEAMEKYGHSVKSFVLTLHTLPLYMANNVEYAIDNYMGAIKEGLEGSDPDGILLYNHFFVLQAIHTNGLQDLLHLLRGSRKCKGRLRHNTCGIFAQIGDQCSKFHTITWSGRPFSKWPLSALAFPVLDAAPPGPRKHSPRFAGATCLHQGNICAGDLRQE